MVLKILVHPFIKTEKLLSKVEICFSPVLTHTSDKLLAFLQADPKTSTVIIFKIFLSKQFQIFVNYLDDFHEHKRLEKEN